MNEMTAHLESREETRSRRRPRPGPRPGDCCSENAPAAARPAWTADATIAVRTSSACSDAPKAAVVRRWRRQSCRRYWRHPANRLMRTRPFMEPRFGHDISRVPVQSNAARPTSLQTQLTVGAVGDPLEKEADRIADQVLAAPTEPARLESTQRFCHDFSHVRIPFRRGGGAIGARGERQGLHGGARHGVGGRVRAGHSRGASADCP